MSILHLRGNKNKKDAELSVMRWRSYLNQWRGPILGTLTVFGGIGAAILTVAARRSGELELARLGAITALVFAALMILFVVPPLTRSARLEAMRIDLPVQITGGGWIFIGVFLVVAFAALNTGNNLLFLIFSLLCSTLFVAWAAARSSLRDLVVSARFPDHIFAGEAAPVIVTLSNTKRVLPSFSILVEARHRIEDTVTNPWARRWARPRYAKRVLAYLMYVPRRAGVEQRVEQIFPQRGHVLITGFELSTRFPFGFFRLRRRLSARQVDLIIYPKPEPAGDELHLLPMNAGRITSARRGTGHDLYSLRDYQAQDDMRHIDWKATARTRRLIVREFAAEDERRVHIILDTRLHEEADGHGDRSVKDGDREVERGPNVGRDRAVQHSKERNEEVKSGDALAARFERGVTVAASLTAHFIDERAEVRLTLGTEAGRYGVGREHLYASLRRLALVAPDSSAANDEPPAAHWQRLAPQSREASGNHVILLTTAAPGSIPSNIWRTSHVIYL